MSEQTRKVGETDLELRVVGKRVRRGWFGRDKHIISFRCDKLGAGINFKSEESSYHSAEIGKKTILKNVPLVRSFKDDRPFGDTYVSLGNYAGFMNFF